jgi:hypothetical protein
MNSAGPPPAGFGATSETRGSAFFYFFDSDLAGFSRIQSDFPEDEAARPRFAGEASIPANPNLLRSHFHSFPPFVGTFIARVSNEEVLPLPKSFSR